MFFTSSGEGWVAHISRTHKKHKCFQVKSMLVGLGRLRPGSFEKCFINQTYFNDFHLFSLESDDRMRNKIVQEWSGKKRSGSAYLPKWQEQALTGVWSTSVKLALTGVWSTSKKERSWPYPQRVWSTVLGKVWSTGPGQRNRRANIKSRAAIYISNILDDWHMGIVDIVVSGFQNSVCWAADSGSIRVSVNFRQAFLKWC